MKDVKWIDTYPLTPMQEGMLYHYLSDRTAGVDLEQIVWTLNEEIHFPLYQQAWNQVIHHIPMLRTSYGWENQEQPLQRIQAETELLLQEQDWRGKSEAQQNNDLEEFMQADRRRGFDLKIAPLMRVVLFRLTDSRYKVLWAFHHILMDGRSFPVVLHQVSQVYEALRENRKILLPTVPSFRKYIEWLQQQNWNGYQFFWQNYLRNFSAPTPLPFSGHSHNRQIVRQREEIEFPLSAGMTRQMKSRMEAQGLTLNTLIQGAWALLLSRYSGERDIVFGAARACRKSSIPEAEDMVGLITNTVPVRVDVDPQQAVLEYLQSLSTRQKELRKVENTPLIRVQEWSELPSGVPLFDSMIVFDHEVLSSALSRLDSRWKERQARLYEQTNFPITLYAYAEEQLLLRIAYDRERFQKSTMERMGRHLRCLLESITNDLQLPLQEISLLTREEEIQLLQTWNATAVEYDRYLCMHQLIEEQVRCSGDQTAVATGIDSISYAHLNEKANQLAHSLIEMGVGPDMGVGVALDRSLEMMIALLGILKAGGAYLPLDVTYPQERLRYMIEDSGIPILLTQERHAEQFTQENLKPVYLDRDWKTIAGYSRENPVTGVNPAHLAYVIYTSGSTGNPKGVMVEHRNAVNFFTGMNQVLEQNPAGVWLAVTSLSFDISVLELFWTLTRGFKVVLAAGLHEESHLQKSMRSIPPSIPELIRSHQVTHLQCTPSLVKMLLLDEEMRDCWKQLTHLLIGGEAFPASLAQQLLPLVRGKILNMYGPTETTIWSTVYPVTEPEGSVPIGKPIANTRIYIVDRQMKLVPVGVEGDLLIGGEGVVRGYLKRPELTAGSFRDDPFSIVPGAGIYITGDRARYREDGNIEYLGRSDFQVKILGHRIEPGEIESLLESHQEVRESVVIPWESSSDTVRLVAYFIPRNGHPVEIQELRNYLRSRLPEHMIPTNVIQLQEFPLTPNGKINRRALPAPEAVEKETDQSIENSTAPRNEWEKILAGIWRRILKLPQVSVQDHFFRLGGHSLLALQLVSAIRREFDVEITLAELFREPTVAGLAEILQQKEIEQADTEIVSETLTEIEQLSDEEVRRLING
jgi:amino acid adenylation domain-containing protein